MLAEIDLMIRGAVIGISVLTFAILASNARTRRKSLSLGAISLALAGEMTRASGIGPVWSPDAIDPAVLLSHFMPLALTWFVLDLFLEPPERREAGRVFYPFASVLVMMCFEPFQAPKVQVPLTLLLFIGLAYVVMRSAQDDLVENRRSFRVVFILMIMLFGITKTITGTLFTPETQPVWLPTSFAATILAFEIVFGYWALRPGGSLWSSDETPRPRTTPEATDLVDTHLLAQIDSAMEHELWRREGLTIGEMADELRVPEHRLRNAINRDLGYRNFPAFVNGYRIAAAKAALAAPENAQKTILEIAYDVGFASLGPFNKAFRAMTGTSPRDYRRSALDDTSIPA
ncbi:AraC family transcriptional regulator [Roseovarius sp. 2305UL8-3]|uniref:AraC family transcriptional regulator n=1 Tax=Roseovarius conchicola TaxID=3121636 RepID=UPI00352791C4